MNFQNACKIFEIPANTNIDLDELKQKYKIYALKFHPDKNKSPNATEQFQEMNSAYEYLCNHSHTNREFNDIFNQPASYSDILFSFLKTIIPVDKDTELIHIIIQKISKVCESKSVEFLERLDKEMLIKIYNLIIKNKETLHINNEYIELIESVINNKSKYDEVIILNPTLEDLLNHNLYRLTVNNEAYLIPLWHHELIYDNNGSDIYVKCNPILPEDIEIDDVNDIHIYRTFKISDLWGKEDIDINVHHRKYNIKINKLLLCPSQHIYILNSGISRINVKNVYDISIQSTVYIHIKLEI